MAVVRRILDGDEQAFEVFFGEYFSRLYRFAMARLEGNEDTAEEVVQATLCKVIDKLVTYRGEAALFSWLCTICRHEISSYYRRQNRQAREVDLIEEIPEVRAALESLAVAENDLEHDLHRKEIARLVQVTLDYLPARYGNALEWKYIEGLSVKEIASRLRVSAKAAESLLTRARQAFRDGFSELNRGSWQWQLGAGRAEGGCRA
jgi:RNA polymerase sigma-70 factor (ECF subfamily)